MHDGTKGEEEGDSGATGTWLTPQRAPETAVLLMVEREGDAKSSVMLRVSMVSHRSELQSLIHKDKDVHTLTGRKTHTHTHTLTMHVMPPVLAQSSIEVLDLAVALAKVKFIHYESELRLCRGAFPFDTNSSLHS